MNAHAQDPEPFARFRADHDSVRLRLDRLDAWLAGLDDGSEPSPLPDFVTHVRRQFATHMAAEDAVLFPAVAEVFPAGTSTLELLHAEHAELRSMLGEIAALARPGFGADREERLRVALRDLVDLLRLHIHREEVAVFEVATRALSAGERMSLAKRVSAFLDVHPPGTSTKGRPS